MALGLTWVPLARFAFAFTTIYLQSSSSIEVCVNCVHLPVS
jgi:hypothetical protein